jgi:hypothetical protein
MTSRYEARVAAAVIPGILALALLLSTGEAAASFAVGERPTPTPLGVVCSTTVPFPSPPTSPRRLAQSQTADDRPVTVLFFGGR